jgi:hypothetical protein
VGEIGVDDSSQENSDSFGLFVFYTTRFAIPEDTIKSVKSDCVKGAAVAFGANIDKVLLMANLPATLYMNAQLQQFAESKAMIEVTRSVDYDPRIFFENEDQINKAFLRFMAEAIEHRKEEDQHNLYMHKSVTSLTSMVDGDKSIHAATTAIFEAVILGSWTAFEVLASDLWVECLNSRPKGLSELSGKDNRIEKQAILRTSRNQQELAGTSRNQQEQDTSLSLKLNDLYRMTEGTYDLSTRMGTLLKEKFRFASLVGIRQAYSAAFSFHPDRIDIALKSSCLDHLSIVRNLIVHKSCKADEKFVKESKDFTDFPRLAVGDTLKLDGRSVTALIQPAFECCNALIKAVDTYIQRPR